MVTENLGWKRLRTPVAEGDLVGTCFHAQPHVSHIFCSALTNARAFFTDHCSG